MMIVTVRPTGIALIVGVLAFGFMFWDSIGVRDIPMSKVQGRIAAGKKPFGYPIGKTSLVVLGLCVLFTVWYVYSGQQWTISLGV